MLRGIVSLLVAVWFLSHRHVRIWYVPEMRARCEEGCVGFGGVLTSGHVRCKALEGFLLKLS